MAKDERFEVLKFGNGRYSIGDSGSVKNNGTGLALSNQVQNSGYAIVHLYEFGKRKAFTIHRLVAEHFVELVPGKEFVDHKDGNKLNNHYTNLRWVDGFENMQYASQNGLLANAAKKAKVRMKKIGADFGFDNSQKYLKKAIPLELIIDGSVKKFRSTRQASQFLGIDHKVLSARIARGLYK